MCVNCHLHHEFDIMESIDRLPQLQDRLVLTLHRPTWQYQLVLFTHNVILRAYYLS